MTDIGVQYEPSLVEAKKCYEKDGLFVVDLETQKLMSINQLLQIKHNSAYNPYLCYVSCHIVHMY